MNRRRQSEEATRFEERRNREDHAPRLRDEVPGLQTLRLELDDCGQLETSHVARHTRHVVVARAAALFIFPCGGRDCDGSHDITRELLRLLRSSVEQFDGKHECFGVRNGSTCHRNLRYRAHASYLHTAP